MVFDRLGAGCGLWVAQVAEAVAHDQNVRHTLVGRPLGEVCQVGRILGLVLEEPVHILDGGDAELLGLYFADSGQHLESRLLVDHSQPNCTSNVLYKGALQGDPESGKPDAHTVWVGDVLIRAEATGTDTFEVNRNLVLTDGARADSVPNLEIETGEIAGAGHASATGRFDDEQLFYLQARGIPEDQARRLVVRGFFGEIIAKIGVPEIRERLTDAIEHELATTESRAAS
jgi:Fe-S cluster assembly protein SufD